MRRFLTLPALALASTSFGLGIGDKAPPLKVQAVVKGQKIDLSHGVHVVEFWATWCGPCKQSIPHLTELAQKYKGKADFTGVSVWENGDDQLGQVRKFVEAMGPKMAYNVDFDGSSKTMAQTWMTAAKQNGIPAAFLVKNGTIMWIGHPMDGLDQAVGQVLDGKFDLAATKVRLDKQAREAEAQMAAQQKMMGPFKTAMIAKDYPGALKALDDIVSKDPELKKQFETTRFVVLAKMESPEVLITATRFASVDYKDDSMTLNSLAWSLVDPASKEPIHHYDAALVLAKQAVAASKTADPYILDTYALALYDSGDKKQALEIETKAVDMLKASKTLDQTYLKDLQDRLDKYKKENS